MTKDLTSGLVLDLSMETLEDYSGNGNDGTATGTTLTLDKDGRLNRARSFNGTSDWISVDDIGPTGTTGTWRFLFKTTNSGSGDVMWSRYDRTKKVWDFVAEADGTISGKIGTTGLSSTDTRTTTSFNDDEWHIFTLTIDGTNQKLYIDGSLEATVARTQSIQTHTVEQFIGKRVYSGAEAPFSGSLYGNKAWNRALTAEEVYQDYSEVAHNYQGLFDGLVCGLDMRNNAKDFSGNGNDGTVSGATLTTDHLGITNSAYNFASGNTITWSNLGTIGTKISLEDTGSGWTVNTNPSYVSATGVSGFVGDLSVVLVFDSTLTTAKITAITDLLSSGYVYPYPKHVSGGITE